ncbi:MAG: hypothetical protein ACKVQU_13620 [Burkholderiales bacterium]
MMIRTLIAAAVLSTMTLAGTDAEAKRLRSHSSTGPHDKPNASAPKKAAKDDHDEKIDVKKANQEGGSGSSIRVNSRESSSSQSSAQSGAAGTVPVAGATTREGDGPHKAAEEAKRNRAEENARLQAKLDAHAAARKREDDLKRAEVAAAMKKQQEQQEAHRIAAEQQAREARRRMIMSSPPTCVIKSVMTDADRAKCRSG